MKPSCDLLLRDLLGPNVQGNRRAAPMLAKIQAVRPRVRLTVRLGSPGSAVQKIDETALKRVLCTYNHQTIFLDELFEQLRPVP